MFNKLVTQTHSLSKASAIKKNKLKSRQTTRAAVVSAITAFPLVWCSQVLSAELSGQIVDKQGNAIANAKVSLKGLDKSQLTDAKGYFIFNDISAGTFELHTSAKNFSHNSLIVKVEDQNVSNLSVSLLPSVIEVIDVQGSVLHASAIESALPVNVISGDELKLKQASTLGETLKNEVGVHSSYYGPVASSPIIRGLDGPRVLITQNGLDAGDASRLGADHAVAAETSTAQQVEVLRGPATLFYGSGAIGGVVNVVDNRVPTSSEAIADWMLQYNDVSNEQQAAVNLQTGFDNWAFHGDAFWRESKDYKLAGEAELEDHDEDHDGDHEAHDDEHDEEHSERLANSASKSNGFTLGSSYLFDQGFVGFSYGNMTREYGIPGHSHGEHEEDHEEEHGVYAKMNQDRLQMLSELKFENTFISKLATKLAYTDYSHEEIDDGEVGTRFDNETFEARADIYHKAMNDWQGAWTLHYKQSDFSAQGAEAFTPPSLTQNIAAAWLEEKHIGQVLIQLGARIEYVTIDIDGYELEHGHEDDHHEHEEEHLTLSDQSFTPLSASVGLVWDYQSGYNIGASTAISQRAPSAGELFAFGPHIGANTYEVGAMFEVEQEGEELHVELSDHEPSVETSFNLDLTWRKFSGDFGFVLSAFYNQIDDYYYQQDTGFIFHDEHGHGEEEHVDEEHIEESSGLPVMQYVQSDAQLYGFEAEVAYQISDEFKLTVLGDYIRAKLTDVQAGENDNLPRIPPLRLAGLLNYQGEQFDGELSLSHYFEQDDIAKLETTTEAYTMFDAHLNYYIDGIGDDLVLYIKGQNLLNENARVHSSFLKDVAPLPARSFSVGIRGSF